MEQLFGNLLSNALKFTPKDSRPVIKIDASLLAPEEYASFEGLHTGMRYYKITIEDNGIGFESRYATQIFKIFKRLHSRMEYAGTGIGLAICKKIMQRHHGEITARSKEGEGAVFTLILPEKQRERVMGDE